MSEDFTGLIAPPPTPLAPDGRLDLDAVEAQAAALVANGLVGAFVCGTTGEGVSLSVDERMALAGRWRAVAPQGFRIIVHVGVLALPDARALAEHARSIGADGVAALPPMYFRPAAVEGLIAWCAQIASAAAELPFYYYHIPALSGVSLPMPELLSGGSERIANLAGLKFTHEDLSEFRACLDLGDRFELFFGRDQMLLAALATGARAAIGTTYNFAAPLYHRIVQAHRTGQLAAARHAQARAVEMIRVFERFGGGPRATKAILRMIGPDCGRVRPPLRDLSEAEQEALRGELERIGFFEYCSKGP